MNSTLIVAAFALGAIAGLRTFTPLFAIALAAHLGWLNLHGTWLSWMASSPALYALAAIAFGELIGDKLPRTPSRTDPFPLGARILSGCLAGAALAAAKSQPAIMAAFAGGIGGLAGAFAGYQVRHQLVTRLHLPDLLVALLEDAIAVGGAIFLVSHV